MLWQLLQPWSIFRELSVELFGVDADEVQAVVGDHLRYRAIVGIVRGSWSVFGSENLSSGTTW